ncbi:MAG: helix-turn-helix domain-containing protein [Rhodospirillaceae bacterium]|nr:helix-turn-helix domain-containing protein [Rhodospirillaceae bacterium]
MQHGVRHAIYAKTQSHLNVMVGSADGEGPYRMSSRVNSLLKGLRVLEELNRQNGATLNDLAKFTGLPRGTTYRLLATLCDGKYATKAPSGGYNLTHAVQALSDGYSDEAWVNSVANPHIHALGQRVVWPLSIATPSGLSMRVRATTDATSPLTMKRAPIGLRMPMQESATGRVYLAYCAREHSEMLLELIDKIPDSDRKIFTRDRRPMTEVVTEVRRLGYAVVDGIQAVSTLAVPILFKDRAIAGMALRYFTKSMKAHEAVKKYLADLQQAAEAISADFAKYDARLDRIAAK